MRGRQGLGGVGAENSMIKILCSWDFNAHKRCVFLRNVEDIILLFAQSLPGEAPSSEYNDQASPSFLMIKKL
jgi:hypothetical protein